MAGDRTQHYLNILLPCVVQMPFITDSCFSKRRHKPGQWSAKLAT